jgi:hypothetical protein
MLLIGAAVAFSLLSGARGTRRAIGPLSVLAFTALVLGAASPLLHDTDWAGLSQRLLWLALLAWLLLAAWQAGSPDQTLSREMT